MPTKRSVNGWITLHKPAGITSAEAVARVKRAIRPEKIGHAGTLDPLATGILPLALGEATKCVPLLMDAKKTYQFSVTFGERRTTDDAEGEVSATSDVVPTPEQIRAMLPRFMGEILQIPPAYSAIKQGGKRAYALARAGQEVALAPRKVTVHALELVTAEYYSFPNLPLEGGGRDTTESGGAGGGEVVSYSACSHPHGAGFAALALARSPLKGEQGYKGEQSVTAHFIATVGKGTYIRSLGRDIAQALGSEAYISRLHRAAVGAFDETNAISLDFLEKSAHSPADFEGGSPSWLLPAHAALDDIPAVTIGGSEWQKLRHGHGFTLSTPVSPAAMVGVFYRDVLVALAESDGAMIRPKRLLNVMQPMSHGENDDDYRRA